MKKKILVFACLLLIGGLSTFFFSGCDKDTNCYVEVTVLDENTMKPIKGVFVKIDANGGSPVYAEGYTNQLGRFDTVFSAPAIFNVYAEYETGYDSLYTPDAFYCYRTGNNTVRLKEGETVTTTVVLEKTIHRDNR